VRRASVAVAIAAALAAPAHAQAPEQAARARELFEAGSHAYTLGQFEAAIQAFEQSHALVPRAGLLFSMAQAHRRQYYADRSRNAEHLRLSILRFRAYLEQVSSGARRADAAEALAELEPIAERLGVLTGEAGTVGKSTRIMITSPVKTARAALDGGEPEPLPLIREVVPGPHRVRVAAAGYFEAEQPITAVEGAIVVQGVELVERPAELRVRVPEGAELFVDGKPQRADAPETVVPLAAGRHWVAVVSDGRHPFAQEVDLGRGGRAALDISLEVTGQRIASYIVLSVAGATVAGGVALALAALDAEAEAVELEERRRTTFLTPTEAIAHDEAVERRNAFRAAAGVTLTSALGLVVTGAMLFALDRSAPPAPPTDRRPVLGIGPSRGGIGLRF
jgi:tetratricopeptide (TPR) repeat protein